MKKLFALLLPLLAAVGCLQEERSQEEILVPAPAQMDCSASSFLMTSQVPKGSEDLIDDCGFISAQTTRFRVLPRLRRP